MTEIRTISLCVSEDAAVNATLEWIEEGVFKQKNIASGLSTQSHLLHVFHSEFVFDVTMEWECQGASVRQHEYDRDMNIYNELLNRWYQNKKHHGPSPKRPDERNYLDWRFDSGSVSETYTFRDLASRQDLFSEKSSLKSASALTNSVWDRWSGASEGFVTELDEQFHNDLKASSFSLACEELQKKAQKQARKDWIEIQNFRGRNEGDLRSSRIVESPLWIVTYWVSEKEYVCVIDGYDGTILGGTRPKDLKKIGVWASVAAASFAAVGGIGFFLIPADNSALTALEIEAGPLAENDYISTEPSSDQYWDADIHSGDGEPMEFFLDEAPASGSNDDLNGEAGPHSTAVSEASGRPDNIPDGSTRTIEPPNSASRSSIDRDTTQRTSQPSDKYNTSPPPSASETSIRPDTADLYKRRCDELGNALSLLGKSLDNLADFSSNNRLPGYGSPTTEIAISRAISVRDSYDIQMRRAVSSNECVRLGEEGSKQTRAALGDTLWSTMAQIQHRYR